ncbi:MAG: hypothetical protein ABR584_05695 [Candidatus Baltobacteraceae bacterium]
MFSTARALIDAGNTAHIPSIVKTLERFGDPALRLAHERGIRIFPLKHGERYENASATLRRLGAAVDDWPAPPAGLFVVEERTVYLKSRSAMTVAHEFGHALDCALGDGVYHSSSDPQLRSLFEAATTFVTPYAATAIDEYFAEALRAFVEANDAGSFWPRATKLRLRKVDAQLYEYVERLFRCALIAAA